MINLPTRMAPRSTVLMPARKEEEKYCPASPVASASSSATVSIPLVLGVEKQDVQIRARMM